MKTSKVARRYAKALVSLCDERGDEVAVRAELRKFEDTLRSVPDAMEFLANPTVAPEPRKNSLEQILALTGTSGSTANLVRLLLDKGRMAELPRVREEFEAALDARSGKVEATVTSAIALTPADAERLRHVLHRLLHKDITFKLSVDPSLIGGLVVRIGNRIYDASVANHLTKLRHQLIAD
jgi:F-type H+-transporting ATPase subunit delta